MHAACSASDQGAGTAEKSTGSFRGKGQMENTPSALASSVCEEWVGRLRRMDELETLRGMVLRRGLVWVLARLAEHYRLTGRDAGGLMARARARVSEVEPAHEPAGIDSETVALDEVALAVVARDWEPGAVVVTLAEHAHSRGQEAAFGAMEVVLAGGPRDAGAVGRHARQSARRQAISTLEALEHHVRDLGMLREAAILVDAVEDLRRV